MKKKGRFAGRRIEASGFLIRVVNLPPTQCYWPRYVYVLRLSSSDGTLQRTKLLCRASARMRSSLAHVRTHSSILWPDDTYVEFSKLRPWSIWKQWRQSPIAVQANFHVTRAISKSPNTARAANKCLTVRVLFLQGNFTLHQTTERLILLINN